MNPITINPPYFHYKATSQECRDKALTIARTQLIEMLFNAGKIVDENETTLQVFGEAVNEIAEFYQEYYKDYNVTSVDVKVGDKQMDKKEFFKDTTTEELIAEMQTYTLGKNIFIAAYKDVVKENLKLQETYQSKLKELN